MPEQRERVKTPDEKYCHECGEIIRAKAEICPRCGVRQPFMGSSGLNLPENFMAQGQPRSRIVAGVLAAVGGGIGLHKFYLGKPGWGIVYILLIWTGISVILGLIEGIYYLTMDDPSFQRRYGGPAWNSKPTDYHATPRT